MSKQDVLQIAAVLVLIVALLGVNDLLVERNVERYLVSHPEVLTRVLKQNQANERRAAAAKIRQNLLDHWSEIATVRAYSVFYNGNNITSQLIKISDVANPGNLNLIATDYRCVYCKGDRDAVERLLKSSPNVRFIFIEAAVLGSESRELAEAALSSADNENYYQVHYRMFDGGVLPATVSDSAVQLASSHRQLAELLGIGSTPLYVLRGEVHIGSINPASKDLSR